MRMKVLIPEKRGEISEFLGLYCLVTVTTLFLVPLLPKRTNTTCSLVPHKFAQTLRARTLEVSVMRLAYPILFLRGAPSALTLDWVFVLHKGQIKQP